MLTRFIGFILLVLLICTIQTSHSATMGQVKTMVFVDAQIATGAEAAVQPLGNIRTFQCYGTTTAGAGASTIEIQVSNDGTHWIVLDTHSLTLGTTATSDNYASAEAWRYIRGNVATISGTNATVSCIVGVQL